MVAVPAKAVPEVVEACGRKGFGGLVIVSSHFAEDGAAGAALEREAVRLAHSYGMRIVGPNCFGVLEHGPGSFDGGTSELGRGRGRPVPADRGDTSGHHRGAL